jgi:hypothetical protein
VLIIGFEQFLVRRAAHGDNVAHGQRKIGRHVLQHGADMAGRPTGRLLPDILAIDQHRTGTRPVGAVDSAQ